MLAFADPAVSAFSPLASRWWSERGDASGESGWETKCEETHRCVVKILGCLVKPEQKGSQKPPAPLVTAHRAVRGLRAGECMKEGLVRAAGVLHVPEAPTPAPPQIAGGLNAEKLIFSGRWFVLKVVVVCGSFDGLQQIAPIIKLLTNKCTSLLQLNDKRQSKGVDFYHYQITGPHCAGNKVRTS